MTLTDYLINIALIALVILQIRGSRLDLKSAIRPVILVAAAAVYYLRAFPTAGNDVILYAVLGGIGLVLGVGCAATTRVWRASDGNGYAKAGVIAAALWIIGIGSRFSIAHDITSQNAWIAGLILMALAEVIARLVVIRIRGARTRETGEVLPAGRRQTVAA
jgi:hypothetical protein